MRVNGSPPPDVVARLIDEATTARAHAYTPYSGFAVGAALRTGDGATFSGANVENASYGLTVCAERVAVFNAVASGARTIDTIAVVTDTPQPTPPCGACRQVLREFVGKNGDMTVILSNLQGIIERTTLDVLLPRSFGPKSLGDL